MNEDKEIIKAQIKELSIKIKAEEGDHLCELHEIRIVDIIIDYSIQHEIEIPLIKYDSYALQRPATKDETAEKTLTRKKISHPQTDEDDKYSYREDLQYFNDFLEAIGEENLVNPRFKIHPDIRELVECWNVD